MKNYLIIGQGSQTIQLLRELFKLNTRPDQLTVLTLSALENKSFIEFIKYYKINYTLTTKTKFDKDLEKILKNKKDIVISISNPFIIKSKYLSKSTFINFHPGLLPTYRGSFSTVHAMIDGSEKTGGTWHYITAKVDKGNILKSIEVPINNNSTAFSLNHAVYNIAIQELQGVLENVELGNKGKKQPYNVGTFYLNSFPDLSKIEDEDLKNRINYFPPKFV
jgi:methionyl-tRNA formyltransferase